MQRYEILFDEIINYNILGLLENIVYTDKYKKYFLKDLNSNRTYQITFKKKITIRPLLKQRYKILLLSKTRPRKSAVELRKKNPFTLGIPL